MEASCIWMCNRHSAALFRFIITFVTVIGFRKQNVKLVFGGQGPLPMRFGSEGDTVSTGAARNGVRSASVLSYKLEFESEH